MIEWIQTPCFTISKRKKIKIINPLRWHANITYSVRDVSKYMWTKLNV